MANYARVVGGQVAEIIEETDEPMACRFHPDLVADLVQVPAEVQPGWLWDGAQFAARPIPAPPPPPPVTARQLRLWLLSRGITAAKVGKAIGNTPDDQRDALSIEWEYGTGFGRDNPLIGLLCGTFSFNPEDMDAGFIEAGAL